MEKSKSAKKLGASIKKFRLAKNMSQGDLCRKLQVDRAYMSNLENGKKNPTLATIEKVANALKVSIADLMQ